MMRELAINDRLQKDQRVLDAVLDAPLEDWSCLEYPDGDRDLLEFVFINSSIIPISGPIETTPVELVVFRSMPHARIVRVEAHYCDEIDDQVHVVQDDRLRPLYDKIMAIEEQGERQQDEIRPPESPLRKITGPDDN